MNIIIKNDGFKELDKLLSDLPKNVENRIMQKAVTKSIRKALPPIKKNAPRHKKGERSPSSMEYGTLKQNLKVKRLKRVRKGEKGARIDTGKAFWGVIIEQGSRYITAAPWFLPAFIQSQEIMLKSLGDEIGKGIELEAKKLGKR